MQSFWVPLLVFNSVLLNTFLSGNAFSSSGSNNVECEELRIEDCAFAVSSSGARCVLEKLVHPQNMFKCQTSTIMAARPVEWIETDDCLNVCGLQRMSVGLSTDALLDSKFTRKFCFSECPSMCPNINDLYTSLAAEEGIYLPSLCEELKKKEKNERGPRRALITTPLYNGYGNGYIASPPTTNPNDNNGFFYSDLSPTSPPSPSPSPSSMSNNYDYYLNSPNGPISSPSVSSPPTSPPLASSPSPSSSTSDNYDYYLNSPYGPISSQSPSSDSYTNLSPPSPSPSSIPSSPIFSYPYPSPPAPSPSNPLFSTYTYSSPPSDSPLYPSSVSPSNSPSPSYPYPSPPSPPLDAFNAGYGVVPPSSQAAPPSDSNGNTFDYNYNGASPPTITNSLENIPENGN